MNNQQKNKPIIFGTKLGMTQVITDNGDSIPVTVIELSNNVVTEVRTTEKDGYAAVQVGAKEKKEKHLNKPQLGNLKKKNLPNLSVLKEFRVTDDQVESYKVGEELDPTEILTADEKVDITGKSIGKGFQGLIKLHNASRGPMSHGSKSHRQPGSIGAGTSPSRVLPGKPMPAHMGAKQVTTKGIKVVEYIKDEKIVLVKGSVPGHDGSLVMIKPASKKWN